MTEPLHLIHRQFAPFTEALEAQIEAFAGNGAALNVELHDMAPGDVYTHLVSGRPADLALVLTDWLPELVAGGRLLPLEGWLGSEPPADWPDGWSGSLRGLQTVEGSTYGIAYHDGPMMLMYRKDLFTDVAVPQTWREFKEVARRLDRHPDGLRGAVIAGLPDGHNNVYDFLIHLASRGGHLLSGRRAAFATSEGVEAMTYLRDLVLGPDAVVTPQALEMDSVASGDHFATGAVAMMWNWCGFGAVAELPGSAVAGNVGFAPVPKGDGSAGRHSSLNIYWVMAIPTTCTQPDLAWRFLRHLASPAMDRITAMSGGTGTRRSTWNDPEVRAQFPYYEIMEAVHDGAMSPPAIVEYPAINEVLSEMSRSVMFGESEPEPALSRAAEAVDRILSERGA